MKITVTQLRNVIRQEVKRAINEGMEYRNIRVGQKLLLRGELGAYEAEVVQVDPRRITRAGYRQPVGGDRPVQVKVVLYPGDEASLLWVNPERLEEPDR